MQKSDLQISSILQLEFLLQKIRVANTGKIATRIFSAKI